MFGPMELFSEGTYLSATDGGERSYYAPIPWAGMVNHLLGGIQIENSSSTGQVKLSLQYSFDGNRWITTSGNIVDDSSSHDIHTGTNSDDFTGIARAALIVSDSNGGSPSLQSVTLKGAWLSGKLY